MINLSEKKIKFGKGNVLLSPRYKKLVLQNVKRKKGDNVSNAVKLKSKMTLEFDTLESLDLVISALNEVRNYMS